MDFEAPPDPPDDYARQFRKEIDFGSGDILIFAAKTSGSLEAN